MLELNAFNRILVVVAHPDDELLGLGGTLYKIKKEFKCFVKVVILGEGITSRSDSRVEESNVKKLSIHRKNILEAKNILGYDELQIYNLPDNQFDTISLLSIIKIVEKEKILFEPQLILTHHNGDVNIDHQLTFQALQHPKIQKQDQTQPLLLESERLTLRSPLHN